MVKFSVYLYRRVFVMYLWEDRRKRVKEDWIRLVEFLPFFTMEITYVISSLLRLKRVTTIKGKKLLAVLFACIHYFNRFLSQCSYICLNVMPCPSLLHTLIKVKKDCLWKQRTHKITKILPPHDYQLHTTPATVE